MMTGFVIYIPEEDIALNSWELHKHSGTRLL